MSLIIKNKLNDKVKVIINKYHKYNIILSI